MCLFPDTPSQSTVHQSQQVQQTRVFSFQGTPFSTVHFSATQNVLLGFFLESHSTVYKTGTEAHRAENHTTYNILHTTYYILDTTYYILHTTYYILHTPNYMWSASNSNKTYIYRYSA